MSRTDQLPAVLPSGAIAPAAAANTYIVPALVVTSGHEAIDRFLNFFATQIENDNTREAYLRAAQEFLGWCERHELGTLAGILPIHVAAWIVDAHTRSLRVARDTQTHRATTPPTRRASRRHRRPRNTR